jgi:hypothetical protein
MSIRYTPPKPAPLPADFEEFYESLTDMEKELHHLATEWLASSYFVQWVPLYKNWTKKKAEAQKAAAQAAAQAVEQNT